MKDLKTKVWKYRDKIKVQINFEVDEEDKSYWDVKEVRARVERNQWMIKHLYRWADFDHSFSIELFAESLENLGRGLLRWDNCVDSEKNGRRALYAAALLRRAYDGHLFDINDKSYDNWASKNQIGWKKYHHPKKKGLMQMTVTQTDDNAMGMDRKEYSNKMYKIIYKRNKKIIDERKEFVWKYIHKYIEQWWD
jgi:hypothetical protein